MTFCFSEVYTSGSSSAAVDTSLCLPIPTKLLVQNGFKYQRLPQYRQFDTLRNTSSSGENWKLNCSYSQQICTQAWNCKRRSGEDTTSPVRQTSLQRQAHSGKSTLWIWRVISMTTYKVYNKVEFQEAFTEFPGEVLSYEIFITEWEEDLGLDW